MEKFDAENKNPIYKELANFNVLVDNEVFFFFLI